MDDRTTRVCDLTDRPIINDCNVKVEFGYGSDRDGDVYRFCVDGDEGVKILKFIESLYVNDRALCDNKIIPRGRRHIE